MTTMTCSDAFDGCSDAFTSCAKILDACGGDFLSAKVGAAWDFGVATLPWWVGIIIVMFFSGIYGYISKRLRPDRDPLKDFDPLAASLVLGFIGGLMVCINTMFLFMVIGGIAVSIIVIIYLNDDPPDFFDNNGVFLTSLAGLFVGFVIWCLVANLWFIPSHEADLAIARAEAAKNDFISTDWEEIEGRAVNDVMVRLEYQWKKEREALEAATCQKQGMEQVEAARLKAYQDTIQWHPLQWVIPYADPQAVASFDMNGGFSVKGLGGHFGGGGGFLGGIGLGGVKGNTDPLEGSGSLKATGRFQSGINRTIEFGWFDTRYVASGAYTTSSLSRTMVVRKEEKNWRKPPEISFIPRETDECLIGRASILRPETEEVFFKECLIKAVIRGSAAQLRLF